MENSNKTDLSRLFPELYMPKDRIPGIPLEELGLSVSSDFAERMREIVDSILGGNKVSLEEEPLAPAEAA